MTEPVKMWAVVRDDGSVMEVYEHRYQAEPHKRFWNKIKGLGPYTIKPCEVRIIEDD